MTAKSTMETSIPNMDFMNFPFGRKTRHSPDAPIRLGIPSSTSQQGAHRTQGVAPQRVGTEA
jgi:hypothetical protein